MSDQVIKHLWEYDHPYYCDPHNWFVPLDKDNGQNRIHPSWPAFLGFLDRNGFDDPDTFLVFRWDWDRDQDPDDGDEPRNDLNLSVMLQSRGDYWHHTVRMTDEDEPAVRAWLAERASTTAAIWEPLLPMAEALKKAKEETQRLRAAVESFRAPLDWHNADHRARIREGMVDTLKTMAGRPAEDIADQLMRYSDSAIWAVEREQARTAELAGVVHASAAQLTDKLAHRTDELALARAALGVALHPDAPGLAASGPYAQHVGYHVEVALADGVLSGRLGAATETGLWVGEDDGEYVPANQIHSVTRIEDSDEDQVSITHETVSCKFCGKPVNAATAHRHDGGWVGDECCWDERLRATE